MINLSDYYVYVCTMFTSEEVLDSPPLLPMAHVPDDQHLS